MAGSRATSAREPGQVRKEAALSGHRRAMRGRPCRSRAAADAPGEPASTEGARSAFPVRRAAGRRRPEPRARLHPPVPPASASLYRRHRPRSFADVVGQEHVVRTLRNAIEQDRVHHAYLFVGSRGTGKTSMAKILAASLNCDRSGPTVTPCGVCDSCRSIADATSLDVIEMDAASNNSVDDIRDLREKVAYAPVSGRHKVYILDEAHMLSTGGVERVPQDARGAAAAHDLRARHDRGEQGAADGRRPLPPLRLRAADPAADRRRAAPRGRRRGDRDPGRGDRADRPLGDRLVPRRARHARAARRLLGRERSRSTTCSPCSAPPTPTCCSAAVDAVDGGDARARAAARPPGSPTPGATSAASSATSRRTCAG